MKRKNDYITSVYPPPIYMEMPWEKPTLWLPIKVANYGVVSYLIALVLCNLIFSEFALTAELWAFGIVEVLGFFYAANHFSKQWLKLDSKRFASKLFMCALSLRIIYVLFSYWYNFATTETAFNRDVGDALWYHKVAVYGASLMRNHEFSVSTYRTMCHAAFSDIGYPIYLSFIYFLTNDSILIARCIKALYGAVTVYLIYKLAVRNFDEPTARIASILCLLMPNLIYYCGDHLKETEMTFLAVLFVERADYIMRQGKIVILQVAALMSIPLVLFTIRTVLALVLVLAFLFALLMSSNRVIGWGKRILILLIVGVFSGVMLVQNTDIMNDAQSVIEQGGTGQKTNAEWRANRANGNKFAKYSGAAIFAPLIFTIPFPTMNYIDYQINQIMLNGGNFDKNIISFFTIFAMFVLLFSGNWRKHVLPLAVMGAYLVVLIFSNFAHSERFHMPALPFELMFAAYGISMFNKKKRIQSLFSYWCVAMCVVAVLWNWFKLAGRGWL